MCTDANLAAGRGGVAGERSYFPPLTPADFQSTSPEARVNYSGFNDIMPAYEGINARIPTDARMSLNIVDRRVNSTQSTGSLWMDEIRSKALYPLQLYYAKPDIVDQSKIQPFYDSIDAYANELASARDESPAWDENYFAENRIRWLRP